MWGEVDFDQFKTVSQAYGEMFMAQREVSASIGMDASVLVTAIRLGSLEDDAELRAIPCIILMCMLDVRNM
jgi:hypothetical protein